MEYERLIDEFCRIKGLRGVVPDADGVVVFTAGEIRVTVRTALQPDTVLLVANLAESPAEGAAKLDRLLMGVNFAYAIGSGMSLSFDPTQNRYCLVCRFPIRQTEPADFTKGFDLFIRQAVEWRQAIQSFRPYLGEAPRQEDLPLSDGLLRV